MTDPDSARTYLAEALHRAGVKPKEASELLGLNHAYFQQYIKYAKPLWLPEAVRRGLVLILPLDEEKLKPPPKKLRSSPNSAARRSQDKNEIDTLIFGKIMNEPDTVEMLGIWNTIGAEIRQLALRVLRAMARDT